jgi:chromosome segregation ATPase
MRGVEVTARINTLAASMGSVIAMGADKVEIANNGKIMIHEVSGGVHGNAEEIKRYSELVEELSDDIAGIYAEKTGKSKEEMRELMKKETWMSAKQAVEMGFADSIFDTKTNTMSILDKFRPDAALTEKVQGLEASLKDSENQITEITAALTERTNDLENAISELTIAKSKLIDMQNEVASIIAERDTVQADLAAAKTQITELESEVVSANESANARANARAIEIAAQAGLAPVEANVDEDDSLKTKTLNEFNQLTPSDRMAFVRNGGKINN